MNQAVGQGNDTEYDPNDLPSNFNPALIEVKNGDGHDVVAVPHATERDSGSLYIREWDGYGSLLPSWRWSQVSFLQIERYDKHPADNAYEKGFRVARKDWSKLPDAILPDDFEEVSDT